jgi:hypothetical protein
MSSLLYSFLEYATGSSTPSSAVSISLIFVVVTSRPLGPDSASLRACSRNYQSIVTFPLVARYCSPSPVYREQRWTVHVFGV